MKAENPSATVKRFTATDKRDGVVIECDVEVDDWGGTAVTRLELRGDDVTAVAQGFPVRRHAQHAAALALSTFGRPERVGKSLRFRPPGAAERAAIYAEHADGGRKPRRGVPVTDDQLATVAKVYREAMDAGDPPTLAVAGAYGVARSTAARWIQRARKGGFLGPARPGAAST